MAGVGQSFTHQVIGVGQAVACLVVHFVFVFAVRNL